MVIGAINPQFSAITLHFGAINLDFLFSPQ